MTAQVSHAACAFPAIAECDSLLRFRCCRARLLRPTSCMTQHAVVLAAHMWLVLDPMPVESRHTAPMMLVSHQSRMPSGSQCLTRGAAYLVAQATPRWGMRCAPAAVCCRRCWSWGSCCCGGAPTRTRARASAPRRCTAQSCAATSRACACCSGDKVSRRLDGGFKGLRGRPSRAVCLRMQRWQWQDSRVFLAPSLNFQLTYVFSAPDLARIRRRSAMMASARCGAPSCFQVCSRLDLESSHRKLTKNPTCDMRAPFLKPSMSCSSRLPPLTLHNGWGKK